jgi:hypothetical protein
MSAVTVALPSKLAANFMIDFNEAVKLLDVTMLAMH